MDSEVKLLNVADVCEATKLGRTTISNEIRTGRLRSIKVGSRRLVPEPALVTWIESHTQRGM